LVLVAWTHLAYAAHQFVHAPDEWSVHCAAFVHLDRLGDSPPSDVAPHVCVAALSDVRAFCAVAVFDPQATVPYQARAP
jgi:hypothetical protein